MQCCRNPEIQTRRTASTKVRIEEWTPGMRNRKQVSVTGASRHEGSTGAVLHHLFVFIFGLKDDTVIMNTSTATLTCWVLVVPQACLRS